MNHLQVRKEKKVVLVYINSRRSEDIKTDFQTILRITSIAQSSKTFRDDRGHPDDYNANRNEYRVV